MRPTSSRLAAVSTATLIVTGLASPASAQTPAPPESSPPEAAAADADPDAIIVTARRREEALQDIPASITALTGEQIQNLVVDGNQDYLRQVPGASLVTSGPDYLNDFSLRGQGSGRLGFSETATGIFKDGHYNAGGGFGGRSFSRLDTFDVDRIEVLRGPQGALYGRNSVGGAVNILTNTPADTFQARGRLYYDDVDRGIAEAIVNVPIGTDLAVRVGGFYDDQNDGHIFNETTNDVVDEQRFIGARAAVRAKPTEALTLDLSYEYYDALTPGFASLGYRANAPANVGGFALDPEPYTRRFLDRVGFTEVQEHTLYGRAVLETGIGDLSLRLNHRRRDAARTNDDGDHFAGLGGFTINGQLVDFEANQTEDFERTGAELFLSASSGRLNWLIGAEAQFFATTILTGADCPGYSATGAPTLLPGCNPGSAVTALPDAGPGGLPLNATQAATALITARLNLNNDAFTEDLESYSLFGSLEYEITDALTATIEARVQRDEKTLDFQRFSQDPLVFFGPGAVPAGRQPERLINNQPAQFCPPSISGTASCAADGGISRDALVLAAERSWTRFTPAASLKYDFSSNHAVYARFATGYRPGGFNTTTPNGLPREQILQLLSFDPETIYSYEVGYRGRPDRGFTLNVAAYYNRTKDLQIVSTPSAQSRGFILQNAGSSEVYGLELEAQKRFVFEGGSLTVRTALSLMDGEFGNGTSALLDNDGDGVPEVVDLSGGAVPRLRDYQAAVSATFERRITEGLRFNSTLSLQSADGGFENPGNSRDYEGYTLVDARVGLATRHLRFSVFAKNLFDERRRLNQIANNDYFSEPRVIGAELRFNF
jgi:outer membrane receptor protein involved in Fe transport